ncbi:MAG: hypothetical protein QXH67_00150 [Candidatus Bathyarchaeia archaeon]
MFYAGLEETRLAVLKALEAKGYKILEDHDDRVKAKRGFSASYYPHEIQVSMIPSEGQTMVSAVIDHRGGEVYLERFFKELEGLLPPPASMPTRPAEDSSAFLSFDLTSPEGLQRTLNVFRDVIPESLERDALKAIKQGEAPEPLISQLKGVIEEYMSSILTSKMLPDEEVMWIHEVTRGIMKKQTVEKWIITNRRIIKWNAENNKHLILGIPMAEVVVMNQHRSSSGSRVGAFTGRGGRIFTGVGVSSSSSTSRTYGDLVFMVGGREAFRFPGISDPNGVKRMIEAIKKAIRV